MISVFLIPPYKIGCRFLEASFLVFRLQPYFENIGKRIIKSPKLYFTDVGLATYLLDISTMEQIARDPLRCHLVENCVISELMKTRFHQGFEPSFYFYRDSNDNEVDLLFKSGNYLIHIEIKSSRTFHSDFLKGLKYFQETAAQKAPHGYLIYNGSQEQKIGTNQVLNFKNCSQVLTV